MNKVHTFIFFCTSLIVSAPALSMENGVNNKNKSHLGIGNIDEDMKDRYFRECEKGNLQEAQTLLTQSNVLEFGFSTATNEAGKTGIQLAAENDRTETVKAIYSLHPQAEKDNFLVWLTQQSSSNKKLKTLLKELDKQNSTANHRPRSLTRAKSFLLRKSYSDL